jgi:serine protease AprX
VVPAQTIQAGQGLYTCANRWGDYSGSALDPANPSNVWLAAEYAGASSTNCNWATFISQVTFAAPAAADFSLSATPANQSVVAGNSTSYSVTITPSGGFSSAVTLSANGLPSGASGTFSPNNQVMTSSTLSVTTTTGAPPGSYPLTITGTSGTLTHTTSVTLTVTAPPPPPDFSLSASPSSRSLSHHGGSVTYVVTITPSNGFTGAVTLSVSGLPSRASAAFNPDPATTSSTLTVTVSNRTATNSYTLIITGVSGGLMHTTMVTLVVM